MSWICNPHLILWFVSKPFMSGSMDECFYWHKSQYSICYANVSVRKFCSMLLQPCGLTVLSHSLQNTHALIRGDQGPAEGPRRAQPADTSVKHRGSWEGGWAPEGNLSFQLCARPELHAGMSRQQHFFFCACVCVCLHILIHSSMCRSICAVWLPVFCAYFEWRDMFVCFYSAPFTSTPSGFVTDLSGSDVTFYFSCCILALGRVWLKRAVLQCRACLFLMCGWNREGVLESCRWIKGTLKSEKEKADSAPLTSGPQTLAHWSLPAPPSTLPTYSNILQHIMGPDRIL